MQTDRPSQGARGDDNTPPDALTTQIEQLAERVAEHGRLLGELSDNRELVVCLLEECAKHSCLTHKELKKQTRSIEHLEWTASQLLQLYRSVHPSETLNWDRLDELRRKQLECCPPSAEPEEPCECVDCREKIRGGRDLVSGYSISQSGRTVQPQRTQEAFPRYTIDFEDFEEKEAPFRAVPAGPFRGFLEPTKEHAQVMHFMSGPGSAGGADPVTFGVYSPTGTLITTGYFPPDVSGAVGSNVVLMTTNFNLLVSIDNGATFKLVDPTTLFPKDTTFGGWGCDQIITYAPSIDRFLWLMQAFPGTGGTRSKNDIGQNAVRLAFASPADIVTHIDQLQLAWSWYDFDSNYFSLGTNGWMDYPDLSVGDNFLYFATDNRNDFLDAKGNKVTSTVGRLIARIPLTEIRDGQINNLRFTQPAKSSNALKSQITQNTGNQLFWAAHKNNTTLTVYSWAESSTSYFWRDVGLLGWPNGSGTGGGSLVSKAPDFADWLNLGSIGNNILGATVRNDEIWFAWTAHSGDGGKGGFSFPHPHVQIAKIRISDFSRIDQLQIWNPDHAYAYPSLATNTDAEVGVSLAFGGDGSPFYGSHAVGLMGDFVVWYAETSQLTLQRQVLDASGNPVKNPDGTNKMQTRWGDYVTARRVSPNGRLFGGFGYAVKTDPSVTGKADPYYILFGRNSVVNPGVPGGGIR